MSSKLLICWAAKSAARFHTTSHAAYMTPSNPLSPRSEEIQIFKCPSTMARAVIVAKPQGHVNAISLVGINRVPSSRLSDWLSKGCSLIVLKLAYIKDYYYY